MQGRVIQGFFVGGQMRPAPVAAPARAVQRALAPSPRAAGPPSPAFGGAGRALQRKGDNASVPIDPVQIGLMPGRGNPLPQPVLAKMEAAFGADFSQVRIHVGPQAARIGAIAFTTGDQIYFAPGRYQPDSVQGQQLLGHELAHVVQQRHGRVRAPDSGVAVVQDRMLEAEADRMGARAAAHAIQRRNAPGSDTVRAGAVAQRRPGPPGRFEPIQRAAALAVVDPSGFASEDAIYNGQIYGIWKNEQYPNKVDEKQLTKDKCLYVGKTNPAVKEDLGARFVTHCTKDKDCPWIVSDSCSYGDDHEKWPYVVRNLTFFEKATRFDVAVAEQYYIQEWGDKKYNKIRALTPEKFAQYKDNKKIFTTWEKYPKWKPV